MPLLADDPTCSKADFARLMSVTKGRVTQWLDARQIYGEAIVGEGRKARLHIERAKAQLRSRLDISQSLINGAASRRALNATGSPPNLRPSDVDSLLKIVAEVPRDVAWHAIKNGAEPWRAYAMAETAKAVLISDSPVSYDIEFDPAFFTAIDWQEIFDWYFLDDPIDTAAWGIERARHEAEQDARLDLAEREGR